MNSVIDRSIVVRSDGELIRFTHPDEWQSRTAFVAALDFSQHAPSHIIGGYDLPRELYQNCGLVHDGKRCNQEHGHGFVVRSVDGFETHIGKDCGHRHLGAKFEEIERQFLIRLDAQDRLARLRELLIQKASLLSRARACIDACDRAAASISAIKHQIERESTLDDVFRKALSSDGNVSVDYLVSDEEYELTKRRFRRQIVGRIDGFAAATAKSPKPQIRDVVLPLLHSLTEELLAGLTSK